MIQDDKGTALLSALAARGRQFKLFKSQQIPVMILVRQAENDLISNQILDFTSVFPVG